VLSEGTPLTNRIGFMQGRLSEPVGNRIQAFPWDNWRDEFQTARRYGFGIMEWTLDQERILMSPRMSAGGVDEIRNLCGGFRISIPSLSGDFIMQAPFYKVSGRERLARLDVLGAVVEACADIGIGLLVVPLVDGGQLCKSREVESLRSGLDQIAPVLNASGVVLAFESDFAPAQLASLIGQYPVGRFGITYDTGNSASLGFDSNQEIAAYGNRIVNVHVKDRILGGGSVPLGTGNANLPSALGCLRNADYQGNLILQTARAENSDHAGVLARYRAMTAACWNGIISDGLGSRI